MKKVILAISFFFIVLTLSGCGVSDVKDETGEKKESLIASNVYKSENAGRSFIAQGSEAFNLSKKNVLSLVVDYQNENQVFFGLEKDGILKTDDGGKSWQSLESFRGKKVYGLDVDSSNSGVVYASGVWQKRGKIYKSENEGETWREIFTEAAEGPIVIALALDRINSNIVYASNSGNILMKSVNGGETWRSIFKSDSPITKIVVSPVRQGVFFLLTSQKDVYKSLDGGKSFSKIDENIKDSLGESSAFHTGVVNFSGAIYLGGDVGIVRSLDNGKKWSKISTLSDSETFPVRALDVNPRNSQEIIYGAARAIYTSKDGGVTWSSFQIDSSSIARVLKYGLTNPQIVYFALSNKK